MVREGHELPAVINNETLRSEALRIRAIEEYMRGHTDAQEIAGYPASAGAAALNSGSNWSSQPSSMFES